MPGRLHARTQQHGKQRGRGTGHQRHEEQRDEDENGVCRCPAERRLKRAGGEQHDKARQRAGKRRRQTVPGKDVRTVQAPPCRAEAHDRDEPERKADPGQFHLPRRPRRDEQATQKGRRKIQAQPVSDSGIGAPGDGGHQNLERPDRGEGDEADGVQVQVQALQRHGMFRPQAHRERCAGCGGKTKRCGHVPAQTGMRPADRVRAAPEYPRSGSRSRDERAQRRSWKREGNCAGRDEVHKREQTRRKRKPGQGPRRRRPGAGARQHRDEIVEGRKDERHDADGESEMRARGRGNVHDRGKRERGRQHEQCEQDKDRKHGSSLVF